MRTAAAVVAARSLLSRSMVRGEDSDVESEDEGLELLLGGLSLSALSNAAWRDEDSDQQQDATTPATTIHAVEHRVDSTDATERKVSLLNIDEITEAETHGCYERAFHCSPIGQLVRPPVRVVDLSSVNNRGNGLVATRPIRKGQVIFTERALEATQIPTKTIGKCRQEPWQSLFPLRACQHCFQSLEPISSVSKNLPLPELWPVPEYQKGDNPDGEMYRIDSSSGRIQCKSCGALFCSQSCRNVHDNRMGNCCDCTLAQDAVVQALHHDLTVANPANGYADEESIEVQPAVLLAVRMFVSLLHRHRASGERGLGALEGLCGSANDITPLELGLEQALEDGTRCYALSSAYKAICNVLVMAKNDREHLSLGVFERLAAIAARNGFAIKTQSPFRPYHSALLRASGGRQTDRHASLLKQVATALGSSDGTLRRDMDRNVEERCTVEVVALFSLTARINHSCSPCAEVRSQEFVDAHIDVVAKCDIQAGEEITISYINVGPSAGRAARDTRRRMRELRTRYLFVCDCVLCSNNGNNR